MLYISRLAPRPRWRPEAGLVPTRSDISARLVSLALDTTAASPPAASSTGSVSTPNSSNVLGTASQSAGLARSHNRANTARAARRRSPSPLSEPQNNALDGQQQQPPP